MKENLRLAVATYLAYCVDKELWKAIEYLKEQVSSEKQLRYVLSKYLKYYHQERIHEGLNKIIEPQHEGHYGEIICIERLGGLLKSYLRKAA